MVVRLTEPAAPARLEPAQIDEMFHALADATRRDIVERVLVGESSVSVLAARYPMSFAAVQKHVSVLERAGLVVKQRRGREQVVRAEIDTVRRLASVLDHFEALWRGRMDRFDQVLAEAVVPPEPLSHQPTRGVPT